MSALNFRLATLEDAPQLQQLVQAAFRAEDSRKGWTADMKLGANFAISVENIQGRITKHEAGMLVATIDQGVLVGTVGVTKTGPNFARLALLAVEQTQQRGGAGRQIVAYAEDYCRRTWGTTKFGLDALNTRELLISWYERCGYRKTGEVTPFPSKDGEDAPQDLWFVELEKDLEASD